tara:strand:+ start:206 stop:1030 length:825 start_codon:yes stop_codon:yes gene_type:complete
MGKRDNSELNNKMMKIMREEIEKELTLNGLRTRLSEAVKDKHKTPGIANTEKVFNQSGRDNKEYVDSVVKKVKDYLKFDNNSNPEFPHQNNSKTDHQSPMYRNNGEQDEFVDDFRGGGMADLGYDTEPSDEFKDRFSKYLEGSSETGNSSDKGTDGQEVGNVVNMKKDKTGERILKTVKRKHKKLSGKAGLAISNKIFQRPNPGFIPSLSEAYEEDICEQCGENIDACECVKDQIEQVKPGLMNTDTNSPKLNEGIQTDIEDMKMLFTYKKKTQ